MVDLLICGGTLLLALIVWLITLRPFIYRRKNDANSTCITIIPKRNLERVTLIVPLGKETIKFERKRIRKGVNIDFVFPLSNKPAQLTVELESGHVLVASV